MIAGRRSISPLWTRRASSYPPIVRLDDPAADAGSELHRARSTEVGRRCRHPMGCPACHPEGSSTIVIGCGRARQARTASLASRSAAASSVSCRFGNANRSFVRPSSGSREERRAGHGRDARVADEPQRERDVVLAVSARSRDVGHDVVGAGRLVDPEAGRPQGRQEQVAPLAVAGDEVVVVARPGSRARRRPRPAAAPPRRRSGSRGRAGCRPTGRAARSSSRSASR